MYVFLTQTIKNITSSEFCRNYANPKEKTLFEIGTHLTAIANT